MQIDPPPARTPCPAPTPVLTRRWLSPESWSLDTYEQLGGYYALRTGAGRGTRADDRVGEELRPARSRRRRLPDRAEVVVPATAW